MTQLKDTTFLLIAGTWCGGWCWEPLSALLRAEGYRVKAPSLSGLADRAHLLTPSLTLEDHVNDIVNAIRYNDLGRVVIVGHSYAGLPITCALDRLPKGAVERAVYIDGLLPEDGEHGAGMMSEQEIAPFFHGSLRDGGLGIPVPEIRKGKMPEEQRIWFQGMMTPHPVRTYQDRVSLAHEPGNGVPSTLIACSRMKMPVLLASRRRAIDRGWDIVGLDSGHNAHVQCPERVARILLDVIGRPSQG